MRLKFSADEMRAVSSNFAQQADDLRSRARVLSWLTEEAARYRSAESVSDEALMTRYAERTALVSRVQQEIVMLQRLGDEAEHLAQQLGAAVQTGETHEQSIWQHMRQLAEHPGRVFSSPMFVASLRALAANIDLPVATMSGGFVGLIWQLSRPQRGPDFTASVGAFATGLTSPTKTTIEVRQTHSREVTAPSTLAELARRIPRADTGAAQVRIERYQTGHRPSWIVYCAGTVSMKPNGGTEPWDMHSNLEAMAGHQSDSMDAVRQSMRTAGVRPDDQVLYVGFSQGGMLAAELAREGQAAKTDLVTFGAPIAQLDLSQVDGAIAVEHAEDLVPALGGKDQVADGGSDRLAVRRHAFASIPAESGLPAHNLDRYASTAADAESAPDRDLRAEKQKVLSGVTGLGQSSLWRAERVGSKDD